MMSRFALHASRDDDDEPEAGVVSWLRPVMSGSSGKTGLCPLSMLLRFTSWMLVCRVPGSIGLLWCGMIGVSSVYDPMPDGKKFNL